MAYKGNEELYDRNARHAQHECVLPAYLRDETGQRRQDDVIVPVCFEAIVYERDCKGKGRLIVSASRIVDDVNYLPVACGNTLKSTFSSMGNDSGLLTVITVR